jgi:hypothetical protein
MESVLAPFVAIPFLRLEFGSGERQATALMSDLDDISSHGLRAGPCFCQAFFPQGRDHGQYRGADENQKKLMCGGFRDGRPVTRSGGYGDHQAACQPILQTAVIHEAGCHSLLPSDDCTNR